MLQRENDDRNKRNPTSLYLIPALLVLALGLLVACAPEGEMMTAAPTEPPEGEQGAMEAEVVMENSTFKPQEITVQPGTTITWVNEDSFDHTVTSGTRGNATDMFDKTVPGGGSFSFTFEEPGTYEYFCSIHPGMHGVVVVEE